jgi:hypothetical protein
VSLGVQIRPIEISFSDTVNLTNCFVDWLKNMLRPIIAQTIIAQTVSLDDAYIAQYYQLHKESLLQKMKDRHIKKPRVKMSDDQKRESHHGSMRKYGRKVRALGIKRDKEKVIRKINKIEVEYNTDGLIKLELLF